MNTIDIQHDVPATGQQPTSIPAWATLAAALVAVVAALIGLAGPATRSVDPAVSAQQAVASAQAQAPELTTEANGNLRDLVAPKHRGDFDAYMAEEGNRATFVNAFQRGLDRDRGAQSGSGTVTNVLAYGFDRDHVWVTASYSDMARGLIWGAVQYCKRYVPGWICDAAGNWLSSMARGYSPMSNHGVWGALYWNRYTGGRW